MVNAFFYVCKSCQSTWKLEEGKGWVDERGNFGFRDSHDDAVIGKPDGEWEPVTFVEKLCLRCNGTYMVLTGNVRSYPVKPLQVLDPGKGEMHVIDLAVDCPVCKVPMLSGREVLDRVINRDRCSKYMLGRIPSTIAVKCPNCKADHLRYDNATSVAHRGR